MTVQINTGSFEGAGDGESLRSALLKANQHFADQMNPHAVTTAQIGAIPASLLGASNGVAILDATGRILAAALPVAFTAPVSTLALNVAGASYGVAPLDAAGRILAAQLPASYTAPFATSAMSSVTAITSAALSTARSISIAGDLAGSALFDGSANATITATLASTGIAAGTYGPLIVSTKGLAVGVVATPSYGTIQVTGSIVAGPVAGNSLTLMGGPAGVGVSIKAAGPDTNVNIGFVPQGAGQVVVSGPLTVTGPITAPIISIAGTLVVPTVAAGSIGVGALTVTGTLSATALISTGSLVAGTATLSMLSAGAISVTSTISAPVFSGNATSASTATTATTAGKLVTPRTLALAGDVVGSVLFDGSAPATITAGLAASGISPGTYGLLVINTKGLVTGSVATAAFGSILATGTITASALAATGPLTSASISTGTALVSTLTASGTLTGSAITASSGTISGTFNAGSGIFGVVTTPTLSVSGTISAATIAATGLITASALIINGPLNSNSTNTGSLTATSASVTGLVSATNITTPNLLSAAVGTFSIGVLTGALTATGTITAAAVAANTLRQGTFGVALLGPDGYLLASQNPNATGFNAQSTLVAAAIISNGSISAATSITATNISASNSVAASLLSANTSVTTPALYTTTINGSTYSAPIAGGKNLIHNSVFRINQRGVPSATSVGVYPADRWYHNDNGAGSRTVGLTTLTDADRIAIGDELATTGMRIQTTGSSGTTDYELMAQRLEFTRNTAGRSITVSFWAKAAAAGQPLAIELQQSFGSGGSPSATVTGIGTTKFSLTTSWVRYVATIAMPSTSGKTFGTNYGTDFVELDFWTSSGTSYAARNGNIGVQTSDITLWGVQLEFGSVATSFEHPHAQTEFLNCQRFYQIGTAFNYYSAYTNGCVITGVYCGIWMRAQPTLTLIANNSSSSTSGLTVAPTGNAGFYAYVLSGTQNNYVLNVVYAMSAEFS